MRERALSANKMHTCVDLDSATQAFDGLDSIDRGERPSLYKPLPPVFMPYRACGVKLSKHGWRWMAVFSIFSPQETTATKHDPCHRRLGGGDPTHNPSPSEFHLPHAKDGARFNAFRGLLGCNDGDGCNALFISFRTGASPKFRFP